MHYDMVKTSMNSTLFKKVCLTEFCTMMMIEYCDITHHILYYCDFNFVNLYSTLNSMTR